MRGITLLIIAALTAVAINAGASDQDMSAELNYSQDCRSDAGLISKGFVVHPTGDFNRLSQRVLAHYEENRSHFVPDMETRLLHGELRKPVLITSMDDVRTPQPEMFGDLLVIKHLETGELYEIRWYANGKKQVVYRTQRCAINFIPLAENALF